MLCSMPILKAMPFANLMSWEPEKPTVISTSFLPRSWHILARSELSTPPENATAICDSGTFSDTASYTACFRSYNDAVISCTQINENLDIWKHHLYILHSKLC